MDKDVTKPCIHLLIVLNIFDRIWLTIVISYILTAVDSPCIT